MVGGGVCSRRGAVLPERVNPMIGVGAGFAAFRRVIGIGTQESGGPVRVSGGPGTGHNIKPARRVGGVEGGEVRQEMGTVQPKVKRTCGNRQKINAMDEFRLVWIASEPGGVCPAIAPENSHHRPVKACRERVATLVKPVSADSLHFRGVEENAQIPNLLLASGQTPLKNARGKIQGLGTGFLVVAGIKSAGTVGPGVTGVWLKGI